jgi:hypothetical protein
MSDYISRWEKIRMDKWVKYWSFAGERALKTAAQTAIATIGVGVTGIFEVDWVNLLSVTALSALMSLLTSVITYDKKVAE